MNSSDLASGFNHFRIPSRMAVSGRSRFKTAVLAMKHFAPFVLCIILANDPVLSAGSKAIRLEFSSSLPGHDQLSTMLEDWCREVNIRTGGRIQVDFYPGGILTPAPQTYDSVITGIADIGFAPMGVTPGRFPLAEVMEQPMGIHNSYLMTELSNDFFRTFKPREFDQVKMLFFLSASPGLLHTKRPIRTLEELKGLKVRCLGGTAARVLKALGTIPIVIPTGDTYDALRKGIVDGVVAAWDSLETMKWGEILPYTTVSYHAATGAPGFVVMNKAKWNSLPPDARQVIDGLCEEYAGNLSRLWDEKDQNTITKWASKNHVSIYLGKEEEKRWAKAVLPLFDAFVKEKSAKGLPAAESLKFCQDWVRMHKNGGRP